MSLKIEYKHKYGLKTTPIEIAKLVGKSYTATLGVSKRSHNGMPDFVAVTVSAPIKRYLKVPYPNNIQKTYKIEEHCPTTIYFTLDNNNNDTPFKVQRIPSGSEHHVDEDTAQRMRGFLDEHKADILAIRDRMVRWNSLAPEERKKQDTPGHKALARQYRQSEPPAGLAR